MPTLIIDWYVPGLERYGMVCTWAGRVWDGLYLCFYVNNCYRILYFAIVQCSQLQKMQKMKILFQLTTTVLTNLLLGVFCETKAQFGQFEHSRAWICRTKVGGGWQGQRKLGSANLSTSMLEFAEPKWARARKAGGGFWQAQRKLSFANLSTQVLKFAEPRLGMVGKGKKHSVLQIRALACSNLQNWGGRWSAKSRETRFRKFGHANARIGGTEGGRWLAKTRKARRFWALVCLNLQNWVCSKHQYNRIEVKNSAVPFCPSLARTTLCIHCVSTLRLCQAMVVMWHCVGRILAHVGQWVWGNGQTVGDSEMSADRKWTIAWPCLGQGLRT